MGASFFTSHIDAELYYGSDHFSTKISASPSLYNLSEAQAAAYASVNTVWKAAYLRAIAPDTRTKGTVAAKNAARAQMCRMAANLAKVIDGGRDVTDSQKIELGLSVRAKPSPIPAPGKPDEFRTTLSAIGTLTLHWKCKNPRGSVGTMYRIHRRVGATGTPVYLGMSGEKQFVDTTIPAGATALVYQVRAFRSTAAGEEAWFNVNFGSGSNTMPIGPAALTLAA